MMMGQGSFLGSKRVRVAIVILAVAVILRLLAFVVLHR